MQIIPIACKISRKRFLQVAQGYKTDEKCAKSKRNVKACIVSFAAVVWARFTTLLSEEKRCVTSQIAAAKLRRLQFVRPKRRLLNTYDRS